MLAILALWIWFIATVTSASAMENKLITHLRKWIENNQVKFQRGFEFQQLCDPGIAMYTSSRGFWKCRTENDCPYGYDCTRNKKGSRVCCPTKDLCPNGCPISNSTGILACHRSESCASSTICDDSLPAHMNGERASVCCMNEQICNNGLPQLDAFNPYPVLHHCYTTQDCRDGFTCDGKNGDEGKEGICCPYRPYPRTLTPEEKQHFEQLLKENDEKIKRRKSFRRDLSFFYPLIGIPSLLLGLTCYFHIKDEFERRDEERRVREFLTKRKRKAQRMPSAEIKESEFQHRGVLKLSEEIGEIKHALEDESSFSLSSVSFEPKYNEIVLIGSAVESVEPAAEEHTQSSPESKSQATLRSQAKTAESSLSKSQATPRSQAKTAESSLSKSQATPRSQAKTAESFLSKSQATPRSQAKTAESSLSKSQATPRSQAKTAESSLSKSQATSRSQAKTAESSLSKKSKGPPSTSTEQKSTATISPEKSALTSPKTKSSMVKSAEKSSSLGTSVRGKISTPSKKSTKAPRPLKLISATSPGPTVATDTLRQRKHSQMGRRKGSQAENSDTPSLSASKAKRYVGKFVEPNISREVNSDDRSFSGSDMNDF